MRSRFRNAVIERRDASAEHVENERVDKAARAGLTPEATPSGAVAFAQARLVLECRKIYFQDLEPANFLDPLIDQ